MITFDGNTLTVGGAWLNDSNSYDPYNPLNLPPYTIRCKFSAGYTPTMGDSQSLVDADENVWDIVKTITSAYSGNWSQLFFGCTSLISVLGANSNGFGGYKKSISAMFRDCSNLVYVAPFDTSNAQWASQVFYGCSHLLEIPALPLGSATDLNCMLYNCSSLRTIPMLDTSSALDFTGFVWNCSSLVEFPAINTSHATKMHQMFSGCSSLTSLPMLDTHAVTDMGSLCYRCSSLVHFPAWNTSANGKMGFMFHGCSSLLEVPNISCALVDDFYEAFSNCTSLTHIPLLDTSAAVDVRRMWAECTAIESGALALYNQMSTQANPPSTYGSCFSYAGSSTASGAQELAQIPTSWGGTMG